MTKSKEWFVDKPLNMRLLAVDDDRITLKFLKACLRVSKKLEVETAEDGKKALELISTHPPDILITDWMMPGLNGVDLCRRIRTLQHDRYMYIILLTAKTDKADIVIGLDAGADDYMVKPFDRDELQARIRAGVRVIQTHLALKKANQELSEALTQIKTLKGLLPICMDCKKVRNDEDYWQEIEEYIRQTTAAEFSHGLCPDCLKKRIDEMGSIRVIR